MNNQKQKIKIKTKQNKKNISTYLSCAVVTLHIILHLYIHLL